MGKPYKLTPEGTIPPSEYVRREKIRMTMRARAKAVLRDSAGRFLSATEKLFYGTTDIRDRETDEVDYGVPWVLRVDLRDGWLDDKEAETLLTDLFGDYAFWNVSVESHWSDILPVIMDRQGVDEREAKAILREMEDTARLYGGALAPLILQSRVTVP